MIEYSDDYLEFYNAYPRHEGKADGFKAWKAMSETDRRVALADVQKRTRLGAWNSSKKLIALPATYLRGRRFEDDWQDTLESSRKPADGFQSRGEVSYTPPVDPFTGTKWDALANRMLLKYLRTLRGMSDTDLKTAVTEKNRTAAELGPVFDEDIDDGRDKVEAVTEFVRVLFDRLDKALGKALAARLMRV